MKRLFSRSLEDLAPSPLMGGSGGDWVDTGADAASPLLVFLAGAAVGGVAVVLANQSTIDGLKDKISNVNKKYQTKGT
jgi:hypothetical protein